MRSAFCCDDLSAGDTNANASPHARVEAEDRFGRLSITTAFYGI
jgi:hypothetical protein